MIFISKSRPNIEMPKILSLETDWMYSISFQCFHSKISAYIQKVSRLKIYWMAKILETYWIQAER